jgi:hypothetical protein
MTIILIVAFCVLLAIDFAQTLSIALAPERFRETWNFVLPAHPSVVQVRTWFAFVILVAALALWLFPDVRRQLALIGCAIELACVVNNYRKGIRP